MQLMGAILHLEYLKSFHGNKIEILHFEIDADFFYCGQI